MKYYCVGIKGAGMGTLANILKDLGNEVSGYDDDTHYKYTEDGLKKRNIKGKPKGKMLGLKMIQRLIFPLQESTQRVFLTHPGEVLQERCFQVKRKMFLLQEISRESSDLELR